MKALTQHRTRGLDFAFAPVSFTLASYRTQNPLAQVDYVRVVDLVIGASKSDICAIRVVTISERAGRRGELGTDFRPWRNIESS